MWIFVITSLASPLRGQAMEGLEHMNVNTEEEEEEEEEEDFGEIP